MHLSSLYTYQVSQDNDCLRDVKKDYWTPLVKTNAADPTEQYKARANSTCSEPLFYISNNIHWYEKENQKTCQLFHSKVHAIPDWKIFQARQLSQQITPTKKIESVKSCVQSQTGPGKRPPTKQNGWLATQCVQHVGHDRSKTEHEQEHSCHSEVR